ncbi:coiled-coil domain-containing protein 94 homolog [Chenopodium quinoa]|uniref:coiled-coil domain-containing protein 94 homolog n=1 Tax=Chenopodium quinoa TaxID=63459 RepID=UPI000B794E29|nr:coiled-coil domain-containing protein 94 homolog [Chenopodium quinoa]
MGERKVLNKYYPPNFDPSKIQRRRKPKNQQMKVRTMLPWSIRCNCAAEFVKKRDPQNSDYVIEAGATRLFEQCRIGEDVIVGEKRKLESEETGDVMKGLENRMLKSKREMDLVARFEELKSVQARRGRVGVDTLLEELKRTGDEKTVDDEDEVLVKSMFRARSEQDVYVPRIDDDDDSDEIANNVCVKKQEVSERTHVLTVGNLTEVDSSKFVTSDGKQPVLQSMAPAVRFMVMRKPTQKSDGDSESVKKEDTASGLQSLCQYDSEDE